MIFLYPGKKTGLTINRPFQMNNRKWRKKLEIKIRRQQMKAINAFLQQGKMTKFKLNFCSNLTYLKSPTDVFMSSI